MSTIKVSSKSFNIKAYSEKKKVEIDELKKKIADTNDINEKLELVKSTLSDVKKESEGGFAQKELLEPWLKALKEIQGQLEEICEEKRGVENKASQAKSEMMISIKEEMKRYAEKQKSPRKLSISTSPLAKEKNSPLSFTTTNPTNPNHHNRSSSYHPPVSAPSSPRIDSPAMTVNRHNRSNSSSPYTPNLRNFVTLSNSTSSSPQINPKPGKERPIEETYAELSAKRIERISQTYAHILAFYYNIKNPDYPFDKNTNIPSPTAYDCKDNIAKITRQIAGLGILVQCLKSLDDIKIKQAFLEKISTVGKQGIEDVVKEFFPKTNNREILIEQTLELHKLFLSNIKTLELDPVKDDEGNIEIPKLSLGKDNGGNNTPLVDIDQKVMISLVKAAALDNIAKKQEYASPQIPRRQIIEEREQRKDISKASAFGERQRTGHF
jgi:hypothetical protein